MTSPNDRFASQHFHPEGIPWVPLGPGESFKPLAFLPGGRGRVLLLRLEPGTLVPRHRHAGEVHAVNLEGHRLLLESDTLVGPGGYVYEPPGNVDSWRAVGDVPVVVLVTAFGAMEMLDAEGRVLQSDGPASLQERYLRYCAEQGLPARDLTARALPHLRPEAA